MMYMAGVNKNLPFAIWLFIRDQHHQASPPMDINQGSKIKLSVVWVHIIDQWTVGSPPGKTWH